MKPTTIAIAALVIAPLAYLYHEKPLIPVHQEKIYRTALGDDAKVEDLAGLPQWEELDLSDWVIATATRDKKRQTMISVGIGRYIKVVDTEWGEKAFEVKTIEEEKKGK